MNNLFQAFTIEVPGQLLDDKKFYQYSDYDNTSTTVPTDAQTLDKGIAFVRLKQIERKLSELAVPVYFKIDYTTSGSATAIPTDAKITVGYISYDAFVNQVPFVEGQVPEDVASSVIKTIIDESLAQEIVGEFVEVQKTVNRAPYPGATTTNNYHELETIYVDVPAETVSTTVSYITL